MAAAGERVGLQLPAEARAWFAWHNGIRFPEPHEQPAGDITNGVTKHELLSLDRAVKECVSLRKLDEDLSKDVGIDSGHKWARWWFPLAVQSNGDVLAIECNVPPGFTTPVRAWDTEACGKDIAAGSLADVVETWVMMLDENLVFWDRERERWWQDVSRIQPWMWRRSAN